MTVYNRTLQIRMTREEKDRILHRMRDEGVHNLSAWARKQLLEGSLRLEQKIDAIYRCVVREGKRRTSQRRNEKRQG